MTKTIAVDDKNDLFIGADGNLAMVSGITAAMQVAQQRAQAQRDEMVFAVDEGIRNFALLWTGPANLAAYEADLRATLLASPDITDVRDLEVSQRENVLGYSATLVTIYGEGLLNG